MLLPLDGVLVVSCEQAVAAPLASRQLADLGARVIKVERPGGGDFARRYDRTVRGLSSHFVWLNRSKESITLDLKDPADRAVMQDLIERADVFLQNYAPGAAERLGLGADQLRAARPELIHCSISGYGTSGPLRDAKAYDLLVQAETGLVSITGSEDAPAKSGIPAADIAAGMYAFSAVLAALYQRATTGTGATLHVNLFDSLLEWMGYPLYYTRYGGTQPRRAGTSHAAIAPYGTYRSGDATAVVLSVQNEREWQRFCEIVLDRPELMARPDFATQADRVAHRAELDELIDAALSGLDGGELLRRLDAAGIANARQRELADVIDHPQLLGRDRWTSVDTPAGEVQALRPPIEWSGVAARMDPVPAAGEHTRSILAEFGHPSS
ncbi:CaiB/BaiF CoA transferase family protein [Microlunatus ginsengisoli]|uniref:CaiB/BaiF CoA-transferase family protein n=1 Tax=Microlunatus ginsengisoli TaxID=363863 RepID=A0ABP6ZU39_9ACTN